MEVLAVLGGLLLLAIAFSETNRPKPAAEHDYGAREWGFVTLLTWSVMAVVFLAVLLFVN